MAKLIRALHDSANAAKFYVNDGTREVIVLRTCNDASAGH
jgi:hypothetical protein